jgi:Ni2+-binding GTPase involved in maturation of urease and hydrogenase
MATVYLILKVGALLVVMLLPLGGPDKRKKGTRMKLSDWAVNEKGELVNLIEIEQAKHHIK